MEALRVDWDVMGLTLTEVINELEMWRRMYLDKPEDRLYHASDGTWWRRDDSRGVGRLVKADSPPGWVKWRSLAELERAVYQLWCEDNDLRPSRYAADEYVKWVKEMRRR